MQNPDLVWPLCETKNFQTIDQLSFLIDKQETISQFMRGKAKRKL